MSKFQMGQRVELLPGREGVYENVFPASRGVVSGHRKDKYGYDLVYIIWDKNHWRYGGEDDLWTLASHFCPIEGEDERELIGSEVPMSPPKEEFTEAAKQEMDDYMDALEFAAEKAAESGAFFFICLKDDQEGHKNIDVLYGIGDPALKKISIADVLAYAEREMRRRGQ